jgi:hypothetical protein
VSRGLRPVVFSFVFFSWARLFDGSAGGVKVAPYRTNDLDAVEDRRMLVSEKAFSELVSHTPIRASARRVRMTMNPGRSAQSTSRSHLSDQCEPRASPARWPSPREPATTAQSMTRALVERNNSNREPADAGVIC